MRKAIHNLTKINVQKSLISLQTCDKNEARDGGAEGMQKTIENLDQIDTYVSKFCRRKHYMPFDVDICNV